VASLLGFWAWAGLQFRDHRPQSHTARNQVIQLLAIFSATFVLSAVAFATVSLSRKRGRGGGWALAGATVSVVLVGLTVMVGSPALQELNQLYCRKTLSALALAVLMYTDSNEDVLPTKGWSDAALSQIRTDVVFRCPEAPGLRSAYAFNHALAGRNIKTVPHPERTVLLSESDLGWNGAGGREALVARPRHRGKDVFAFVDGHAASLERKQESHLIWRP